MDQKAGAQISQRTLLQSLAILFVLMMIAGVLTLGGQAVGRPGEGRFPVIVVANDYGPF